MDLLSVVKLVLQIVFYEKKDKLGEHLNWWKFLIT